MNRPRHILHESEHGNVALEMALILPFLCMITFGGVDFARLFYAYMTVSSAAHEAAAYAELNANETAYVALSTADRLNALMGVAAAESGGYLVFSGTSANSSMSQPALVSGTGASSMQKVQVTYQFKPIVPIPLPGPIPVTAIAAAR